MNKINLNSQKNDFIVYISMFILLVTMFLGLFIMNSKTKKGSAITVSYYGEIVHIMYLNVDEEFELKQSDYPKLLGDMKIVVENGKVSIDKQTSWHNYCELMGDQDKAGVSLVCAPNGVVVTIEGFDASEIDFILR